MKRSNGYWIRNPANIDAAFDKMKSQLGRDPKSREFDKKHRGAYEAIRKGLYDTTIHSWGEYKRKRGSEVKNTQPGYWSEHPENIDVAFDKMKLELCRNPTFEEFNAKNRGATMAIRNGSYSPEVSSWEEYHTHRGLEVYRGDSNMQKWNNKPKNVDNVFDRLMSRLGRVPKSAEFNHFCGGAAHSVIDGRYDANHPEVNSYTAYLRHRGLWNEQISSPQKLIDLLKSEQTAQHAVRLAHGDESDLADILVVIYQGRVTREDVLQFAENPSLREYLGSFRGPGGLRDIIDPVESLLPLDKEDVIRGLMLRRLREYSRQKLGPRPTQEEQEALLQELDKEIGELVA